MKPVSRHSHNSHAIGTHFGAASADLPSRPRCPASIMTGMEIHPDTNESSDSSWVPLARLLELDEGDVDAKIWRDDFLTLGGRLRFLYGTQIAIDEVTSSYLVSIRGVQVSVTCSDEMPRAETVQIACPVAAMSETDTHLWKFSLRENACLSLARLSFESGVLWANYELPFCVANGPALDAGVSAVGRVAEGLANELTLAA